MDSRLSWLAVGVAFCGYACGIQQASAVEPGVAAEISWERLSLPNTQLTFRTSFGAPIGVTPVTNHDGKVDGTRVDLSYGIKSTLFGGSIVGVKGFYGRDSSTQNFACAAGSLAAGFCDVLPLVDSIPNPVPAASQNTFGSGNSGVTYITDRRVDHWGLALELQPNSWGNVFTATPATKDAPAVQSFAPKAGLGFRQIAQHTTISARDAVFGTTLNYDEKLNTSYTGAFLGLIAKQPLGAGFVASLDGEAGLYWAHAAYNGTMLSSAVNAGNSSLSLSKDRAAVVAAIKAAIDKEFSNWTIGVFTRAEWYSYAPEMNYNTFDRTGAVTSFSGPNDGTSIGNSSAWTWSVGGRIALKLN